VSGRHGNSLGVRDVLPRQGKGPAAAVSGG
jgi:hypothetical protein